MARTKVKINRQAWGRQVTGSDGMERHVGALAGAVAARLPGSKVTTSVTRAVGGGLRARATVQTTLTMAEEVETGQALAALKSVVPTGHRTRGSSSAGRKKSAGRKQAARAKNRVIRARRKAKGAA